MRWIARYGRDFINSLFLLAKPVKEALDQDKQETSKKQAYDLLDALSRSGSLNFDSAELHIVIAATHYFDKVASLSFPGLIS